MEEKEFSAFPFITRKMLAFEYGARFSLVVKSMAAAAVSITIKGATREGLFTYRHIPTTGYSLKTESFNIPDIPLWVSALDIDGNFSAGTAFIRIYLALNGDIIQQLVGGYVHANRGISWPQTQNEHEVPEVVIPIEFEGTDPAAGADISESVPAGLLYKLKAIKFALVTDATVADRTVYILLQVDGRNIYKFYSTIVQPASLTRYYYCYPNSSGGALSGGTDIIIPISPDIVLKNGSIFTISALNKVAGDNFSKPSMLFQQYITA